jgi:hypothetical protein
MNSENNNSYPQIHEARPVVIMPVASSPAPQQQVNYTYVANPQQSALVSEGQEDLKKAE